MVIRSMPVHSNVACASRWAGYALKIAMCGGRKKRAVPNLSYVLARRVASTPEGGCTATASPYCRREHFRVFRP